MQQIVSDKPYRFVPPRSGTFLPKCMSCLIPRELRKHHGVTSYEFRGQDRLRASLAAGHGIMLAPNHCRPCDPFVVGLIAHRMGVLLYTMASWHLFLRGWYPRWMLPRVGVFSLYREGLDREALKCAIEILVSARRPLLLFSEGVITRTNDRLNPLLEGTAFMARNAAKQRAAADPPGKVVIHPVAIRYFFGGDVEAAVLSVLESIEHRLSWQPQRDKSLPARLEKVGNALLTLKELEYLGQSQSGSLSDRLARLIDHVLVPLEQQWLKGRREGSVVLRVKTLRSAIVPDLVGGDLDETDRARRWRHLADLYMAQQLSFYPPDYLDSPPTPEQLLETVERFEEDLTDTARVHRPLHVIAEIGEAIEVPPTRVRGEETDPVTAALREQLETMLAALKTQRPAASPARPA
jgi:1-acyl-sn-glycerol-3-phosphate acyltransferase